MLKAAFSSGSVDVHYIHNYDQLKRDVYLLTLPLKFYIAEEYIRGNTLRIDGYVVDGKVQLVYPAYYEPSCYEFYNFGQPQITYTKFEPTALKKIEEFTRRVIKALSYDHGVFHLEAIEDTHGKLYFLEIAARPGHDSDYLKNQFGYDAEELNFDLQLGRKIDPEKYVKACLKTQCSIVDCPTLPRNGGKWAYQKLLQMPAMKFPSGSNLAFENRPKNVDIYELTGVTPTFLSVGFSGKDALKHAREFVSSLKGGQFAVNESKANSIWQNFLAFSFSKRRQLLWEPSKP